MFWIWVSGFIVSMFLFYKNNKETDNTYDIMIALFLSMGSWVSVIIITENVKDVFNKVTNIFNKVDQKFKGESHE